MLAGGQSLIPVMKLRFVAPSAVVDINRIPGLDALRGERRAHVRGARPPQDVRALAAAPRPLRAPRRRGAADLGPARPQPRHRRGLARARRPAGRLGLGDARLGAEVTPQGAAASATIPIDELLLGPFTTSLGRRRDRSPRSACPIPARARAAPTSSSSARSATSRPSASPFRSRLDAVPCRRPGSRSPASRRPTCARPRAEEALAGHGADRRGDPRGGPACGRGRATRSTTCAAPPSTSGTSSASSSSAACAAPRRSERGDGGDARVRRAGGRGGRRSARLARRSSVMDEIEGGAASDRRTPWIT